MIPNPKLSAPSPIGSTDVLPWEELEQALLDLAYRPDQEAIVVSTLSALQKQADLRPLIDTVRELVVFCWMTLLEEPALPMSRPCAVPSDVEAAMP